MPTLKIEKTTRVTTSLTLDELREALLVPKDAIIQVDDEYGVWRSLESYNDFSVLRVITETQETSE